MGKWEPIYCSQDLIHLVYHMVGDLAYQGYWGQIHWAVRPGQRVKLGLRERLDLMFLQKANKEGNCMTLRGKSKLWKFNFNRHREAWVIWSLWFDTFCARIEILVYLKLVNRPLVLFIIHLLGGLWISPLGSINLYHIINYLLIIVCNIRLNLQSE